MQRRTPLMLVLALAVSAPVAMAQGAPPTPPPAGGAPGGPGGPGGFAQRRMGMLLQGITLTPAQQARIDSITTRFAAQMPAFTPGQMPSPEDRALRRQLMQSQDSTIRATVLSPDQQRVWDANAANMPQRRPGN